MVFLEPGSMNKLLEFGRKAWFVIRVMSGYEERMIRSQRLELQRRFEVAQAKKAALRKLPEQTILAEVRQTVEEMQSLNKKLEETEAAIEEYFKPLDKEAEIIMNMQLKEEEKTMKMMVKAMEEQAFEKAILGSASKVVNHEGIQQESQGKASGNADDVLTK